MSPIKLKLGHFAAQLEEHFDEHWIPTPSFESAAQLGMPIIFGAKGCGKTALARHLVEMRGDKSVACRQLDLTQLRHRRIVGQLKQLSKTLQTDKATLLANYWRHLFLLCFLREASTTCEGVDDTSLSALGRIREVLQPHELEDNARHVGNSLLGFLSRGRRRLEEALVKRRKQRTPSPIDGLTDAELNALERYPNDQRFVDICVVAAGLFAREKRHFSIVVDGLDHVEQDDRRAHIIVLSAIVQAVKRLALDPWMSEVLSVKILIPRELFFALPDRDLDQYVTLQTHLSWEPEALYRLVEKRILAACARSGHTAASLQQILPHELSAGSLRDYLARHSMYRPRQILHYIQKILDRSTNFPTTEADVVLAIKAASIDLTDYFLIEYRFKYPSLLQTLSRISGIRTVVPIATLLQRLADDSLASLKMLYDCGALGIIEEMPAGLDTDPSDCSRTVEGMKRPVRCEFIYKPGARPYLLPGLPNDTLVALHPMLHARFGFLATPDFVIG